MAAHELYEEQEELQLRLWEGEIARLRAVEQAAPDDARIGYTYLLHVLRQRMAVARHDLEVLEASGGPSWDALRARFETDAHNLQVAVNRAIALLPGLTARQ